jgi:hypothetical protein
MSFAGGDEHITRTRDRHSESHGILSLWYKSERFL